MAIKRRFSELRDLILKNLASGQKTVNQVSTETGINWKTVDNHLVHLVGKGLAKEVIHTEYVKIFEITDRGRERLTGGAV
jgi:predicted transcriptional regulator